jgi:CBL proto-oncogene N-terminus, EF hand-like domain
LGDDQDDDSSSPSSPGYFDVAKEKALAYLSYVPLSEMPSVLPESSSSSSSTGRSVVHNDVLRSSTGPYSVRLPDGGDYSSSSSHSSSSDDDNNDVNRKRTCTPPIDIGVSLSSSGGSREPRERTASLSMPTAKVELLATDDDDSGEAMSPADHVPSADAAQDFGAPYDAFDPDVDEYCQLKPGDEPLSKKKPSHVADDGQLQKRQKMSHHQPGDDDLTKSEPQPSSSASAATAATTRASTAAAQSSGDANRRCGRNRRRLACSDDALSTSTVTSSALETGQRIVAFILELCSSADKRGASQQFLTRENRARLTFLKDTLDLILAYVSKQRTSVTSTSAYQQILRALSEQLEQTLTMVTRVVRKKSTITPNFDIFELTLRRYLEQLRKMFPLSAPAAPPPRVLSAPSALIRDAKAREVWEDAFGSHCHHVTFNRFLDEIVEQRLLQSKGWTESESFVQFLRYFIHFPADNVVTTYKWDTLMRLFGPYDSFVVNFGSVALGRGFLGLTNRIKAYEILTMKHARRCLLIRFSRTEPAFLAFSYKNSRGEIGHQINRDSKGRPIPVEKFMRQRFPNYTLVSERLDVATILGASYSTTLCDYANTAAGYIV